MITPKAMLEISQNAYKKGIINTNENRFLSQISNRIVLKDLISNVEEKKIQSIFLKIFKYPQIDLLNESLDESTIKEFHNYISNTDFTNTDLILEKEVETGLLGVVLEEVADVSVTNAELDSLAFFQIKKIGGTVNIILNSEHLFYSKIMEIKRKSPEGFDLLFSLITSWGIVEKEVNNDINAQFFKDIREDWGRELRARLNNYE